MKNIKWFECKILDSQIARGHYFMFVDNMERAYSSLESFEHTILLKEKRIRADGVVLWLSSHAAILLDELHFNWKQYFVRELSQSPPKNEFSLLVGRPDAMNYL